MDIRHVRSYLIVCSLVAVFCSHQAFTQQNSATSGTTALHASEERDAPQDCDFEIGSWKILLKRYASPHGFDHLGRVRRDFRHPKGLGWPVRDRRIQEWSRRVSRPGHAEWEVDLYSIHLVEHHLEYSSLWAVLLQWRQDLGSQHGSDSGERCAREKGAE
jgi:hypothetical protein